MHSSFSRAALDGEIQRVTAKRRSRWFAGAGACACAVVLHAVPAAAAFLEGEAVYRERIMPPADAVLVVTLEDTARADAAAVELATGRMRLASGPPYRWRLDYDERLIDARSRPTLRARIETPNGLWMTTDTVTPAFGGPAAVVLQLRSMPAVRDRCADAGTQAALNACAYDGFLDASAAISHQLRQVESVLQPAQRTAWRRVQKAWLTFRTEACRFESSAVKHGSASPMVQWQCATRMTRQRSADLSRLLACPEGDVACPTHRFRKAP